MFIVFSTFTRLSFFKTENTETLGITYNSCTWALRLPLFSLLFHFGLSSWHSLSVAIIVLVVAVSCSKEARSIPLTHLDLRSSYTSRFVLAHFVMSSFPSYFNYL